MRHGLKHLELAAMASQSGSANRAMGSFNVGLTMYLHLLLIRACRNDKLILRGAEPPLEEALIPDVEDALS